MTEKARLWICFLLIAFLVTVPGIPQTIARADGSGPLLETLLLNLTALSSTSPRNPKMESRLSQLASIQIQGEDMTSFAGARGIELEAGLVRVILETSSPEDAIQEAHALGAKLEGKYGDMIQVLAPVSALDTLADQPSVNFVRLPLRTVFETITSEGVSVIGANIWQQAGYDGTGVKVAVVDGSFNCYASLLGTELPASVVTKSFRADQNLQMGSVHGTAAAEIVYDVAPGAQLYLVNFGTEVELGNAVDWLIGQGVNVISASFGFPVGGPGNGTGPINDIVSKAKAGGVLWVNAAGNQAQRHWSGPWYDSDNDRILNISNQNGDEGNTIYAASGQIIVASLRWHDPWTASTNDYDLYLVESQTGSILAASLNVQNGSQNPREELAYQVQTAGYYALVITRSNSANDTELDLFTSNQDLEYRTVRSSLVVPGDSLNAVTVGAFAWTNPGKAEDFSSQGPTKDNRPKPDMAAPDGVGTASYGTGGFFGTSASTPHVAGAAALVKQAYPDYTPASLQTFLLYSAKTHNQRYVYGWGEVSLAGPGNPTWASRYSGLANSEDFATAIKVDPEGNVYVTGFSLGNSTDYDIVTLKYNNSGNQLWSARYATTGRDFARGIAVDSSGNVYVTGYVYGPPGGGYVVKYNSLGKETWVARYDFYSTNALVLGVCPSNSFSQAREV